MSDFELLFKFVEILIFVSVVVLLDRKFMKPMLKRTFIGLAPQKFSLLSAAFSLFFFLITLVAILVIFNIDSAAYAMMTSLGVAGIIIGLAVKDIVGDVFSGFLIFSERSINVGDSIEFEGRFGTVEDISLRVTRIATNEGELITIPNTLLRSKLVINRTATGKTIRVSLSVGVDYSADLGKALRICGRILSAHSGIVKDPAPIVAYSNFSSSSIEMVLRFWVDVSEQSVLGVKSDVIMSVMKEFKKAGIEIPFDQLVISRRSARYLRRKPSCSA